jgi:hypothetical protein
MRKSSVRGIAVSPFWLLKKKTAIAGGFWNLASDLFCEEREPAVIPPPNGWTG